MNNIYMVVVAHRVEYEGTSTRIHGQAFSKIEDAINMAQQCAHEEAKDEPFDDTHPMTMEDPEKCKKACQFLGYATVATIKPYYDTTVEVTIAQYEVV